MNRTCKSCGEDKPLELFKKNGQWRNHTCKRCDANRVLQWQRDNPERTRAKNNAWLKAHPGIYSEYQAQWAKENPEARRRAVAKYRASEHGRTKALSYARAYRELNRELMTQKKLAWMKANKGKVNAVTRARHARKLQASPSWRNDFFIAEAYDIAVRRSEATGFEWNVDHIVPLKSDRVCGLHVESNFQVIPRLANISKGNRVWPDME